MTSPLALRIWTLSCEAGPGFCTCSTTWNALTARKLFCSDARSCLVVGLGACVAPLLAFAFAACFHGSEQPAISITLARKSTRKARKRPDEMHDGTSQKQ